MHPLIIDPNERERKRIAAVDVCYISACLLQKCSMWGMIENACERGTGGEGGIRTHGTHKGYNGFRDRPVRPLRHLSIEAASST